jgi:TolB protein
MRRPNKFLADLTRDSQIEFLDLLPAFQAADGNVFLEYDEHMSLHGHQVMADAIGGHIEVSLGKAAIRRLSKELAGDRYPMYSADGSQISYQSIRDRNSELFVASPDFLTRRRLTYNDVDECHPMLSRDGSQILFTQGASGSLQTDVVVMNLDGSGRTVLTPGPYEFGAIPTFSRSNTKIAYAGWEYEPATRKYSQAQIVVLDVITGQRKRLTAGNREAWRPVFFPDETSLVYIATSPSSKGFDLYAYELATGVERQLTQTDFDEWDPQVSPDGARIVYAARPDGNWDLFIRDMATGNTTRLTQTTGDEWDPSFAPDGTSIVYGGRFGLLEGIFGMPVRR